MQVDYPSIDPNEDLTQILPIQQKRTIAFVNHFLMKTVSHLNHFAQTCESRFMEFENKIQKIEASLSILESQLNVEDHHKTLQLSSISGLDNVDKNIENVENPVNKTAENLDVDLPDISDKTEDEQISQTEPVSDIQGIKAKDDPRFKKFFKMLQFGVPEPAVKLKMQNEGVNPAILNKPDDIIPHLSEDLLQNECEEKSD